MWHKLEDFQGRKINYGFACHKQQNRQAFVTHWDVMRLTEKIKDMFLFTPFFI